MFENGAHLIGGYGIHSASEGYKLHKVYIKRFGRKGYIFGGGVKSGVIGPLVAHIHRKWLHKVADAVLAYDGSAKPAKQLVYTVVYLGIKMIGPSCKYNNRYALFLGRLYKFVGLGSYVCKIIGIGGVSFFYRNLYSAFLNARKTFF